LGGGILQENLKDLDYGKIEEISKDMSPLEYRRMSRTKGGVEIL
jgi:hypothetical protein